MKAMKEAVFHRGRVASGTGRSAKACCLWASS